MSEPLERNQVIELLDKLGSEQDEDVLAAARMLHSQIIESGMGWEDLLVGDEPEGEEETQDDSLPDEDDGDDEDDEEETQDDSLPDEDDGDDEDDEEETQDDSLPDEDDEDDEDTVEPDTRFTGDETQTLSLIEKLLARDGISSELREELDEYKTDISGGEFQSSDHRYIHSLYARLTKN